MQKLSDKEAEQLEAERLRIAAEQEREQVLQWKKANADRAWAEFCECVLASATTVNDKIAERGLFLEVSQLAGEKKTVATALTKDKKDLGPKLSYLLMSEYKIEAVFREAGTGPGSVKPLDLFEFNRDMPAFQMVSLLERYVNGL